MRRTSSPTLDGIVAAEPEVAQTDHLLRRLTMTTGPGRAAALLARHGSPDAVRAALVAAPPRPFEPPGDLDIGFDGVPERLDDGDRLVVWWVERMASPEAGLHDRMMWIWHTLLTTSVDKAPTIACWQQLRTLHTHALGNFGELLRAMLDDAALFTFLDADGSRREDPNENLGRELLELFTLGRGNYGQSDVRAAATVLAGRYLDWDRGAIVVDQDQPRARRRQLLGRDDVADLDDLCQAVLDHHACASHVTRHIWSHLGGTTYDPDEVEGWIEDFRSSGYAIAPLVEAMVSSQAFADAPLARPRSGLEWFLAVQAATAHDDWNAWDLYTLGQMPFRPPNVAGWPGWHRWTSPTAALGRGSWVTWFDPPTAHDLVADGVADGGVDGVVDAVLGQCSLSEVSVRTRRALQGLAAELLPFDLDGDPTPAVVTLLRAATLCPEFALA